MLWHVCASSYQKGHLTRQGEKEYFNNLRPSSKLYADILRMEYKVCPPPDPPDLLGYTVQDRRYVFQPARRLLWSRKDTSPSPSLSSFYLSSMPQAINQSRPQSGPWGYNRWMINLSFHLLLSPLWLLFLCLSCISELTAKPQKEHPHSSNKGPHLFV